MRLLGMISMAFVTLMANTGTNCQEKEELWVNLADRALSGPQVNCKLLNKALDVMADYSITTSYANSDKEVAEELLKVDRKFCGNH